MKQQPNDNQPSEWPPNLFCLPTNKKNISAYIDGCRAAGVTDDYNFVTIDLFEEKNLEQVKSKSNHKKNLQNQRLGRSECCHVEASHWTWLWEANWRLCYSRLAPHFAGRKFFFDKKKKKKLQRRLRCFRRLQGRRRGSASCTSQHWRRRRETVRAWLDFFFLLFLCGSTGAAHLAGHKSLTANTGVAECAVCSKPISGACINAVNKTWHPRCFRCKKCDTVLSEKKYYEHQDKPYCDRCILMVNPQTKVKAATSDKGASLFK